MRTEAQKQKNKEYMREWKRTHREEALKRGREYYRKRIVDPAYRAALFAKQNERSKLPKYVAKRNLTKRITKRRRYAEDPSYMLTHRLRSRLTAALKGLCKAAPTRELLGCSAEELKKHLESLFQPGMSWENRQEWHIDHIRPCASFNLLEPEQQRCCFHYSNLQPLWAKDNIAKSHGGFWKRQKKEG